MNDKEQQTVERFYKKINKLSGTDKMTLDLKLKKDWSFERRSFLGGVQYLFNLSEKYKVSVIKHFGSYGATADKWEIAVFKNDDFVKIPGILDETCRGWLSDEDVEEILEKVKKFLDKKGSKDGQRLHNFDG